MRTVSRAASRAFVRNRLVCIAREGSALGRAPPSTPKELVARIATGDRIAIADAGVPAGDYARQSLAATGDLEALRPHLVGQEDVRAVLRAVDSGQAVAGFVYATMRESPRWSHSSPSSPRLTTPSRIMRR